MNVLQLAYTPLLMVLAFATFCTVISAIIILRCDHSIPTLMFLLGSIIAMILAWVSEVIEGEIFRLWILNANDSRLDSLQPRLQASQGACVVTGIIAGIGFVLFALRFQRHSHRKAEIADGKPPVAPQTFR